MPDRDEVELGLGGVEGLADVRQSDVCNGQLRFATAATRIRVSRTSNDRGGEVEGSPVPWTVIVSTAGVLYA
jgi:hypothetical protein